jgi:hypothetical protein
MNRERRRGQRADLGRRDSERLPLCRSIAWRCREDPQLRHGLLISLSARGLALLVTPEDMPEVGTRILPSGRARTYRWRGPARIVRAELLSGALAVVAAEYADKTEEATAGEGKHCANA